MTELQYQKRGVVIVHALINELEAIEKVAAAGGEVVGAVAKKGIAALEKVLTPQQLQAAYHQAGGEVKEVRKLVPWFRRFGSGEQAEALRVAKQQSRSTQANVAATEALQRRSAWESLSSGAPEERAAARQYLSQVQSAGGGGFFNPGGFIKKPPPPPSFFSSMPGMPQTTMGQAAMVGGGGLLLGGGGLLAAQQLLKQRNPYQQVY